MRLSPGRYSIRICRYLERWMQGTLSLCTPALEKGASCEEDLGTLTILLVWLAPGEGSNYMDIGILIGEVIV